MVCKVARLMPRPASCSRIMGDTAKIAWGTGRQAKWKTVADMIPTSYMVQAVTCTRHKASAQRSTICISWLQPVTSSHYDLLSIQSEGHLHQEASAWVRDVGHHGLFGQLQRHRLHV